MRHALTAILLSLCALASGCASLTAPSYSADYGALDPLKRAGLAKAAVGKVQPDDANAKVNQISLRGATLTATDGTFTSYLERALIADLRDVGIYDSSAPKRIDIVLLRNDIDVSGISTGVGEIEIDLTLTESGKTLLRKNYSAQTTFESSFAGAIALLKGQSEYPNLVRALLATVYRDPTFVQAMR